MQEGYLLCKHCHLEQGSKMAAFKESFLQLSTQSNLSEPDLTLPLVFSALFYVCFSLASSVCFWTGLGCLFCVMDLFNLGDFFF